MFFQNNVVIGNWQSWFVNHDLVRPVTTKHSMTPQWISCKIVEYISKLISKWPPFWKAPRWPPHRTRHPISSAKIQIVKSMTAMNPISQALSKARSPRNSLLISSMWMHFSLARNEMNSRLYRWYLWLLEFSWLRWTEQSSSPVNFFPYHRKIPLKQDHCSVCGYRERSKGAPEDKLDSYIILAYLDEFPVRCVPRLDKSVHFWRERQTIIWKA